MSSTSLLAQCQLPGPSVCVTMETVTVGARKWAEGVRVHAGAGVWLPSLPSSAATVSSDAMPRVCGWEVTSPPPGHRPAPSQPGRLQKACP